MGLFWKRKSGDQFVSLKLNEPLPEKTGATAVETAETNGSDSGESLAKVDAGCTYPAAYRDGSQLNRFRPALGQLQSRLNRLRQRFQPLNGKKSECAKWTLRNPRCDRRDLLLLLLLARLLPLLYLV